MELYFSDFRSHGKKTILPNIGMVEISNDGILNIEDEDFAKSLIDDVNIIDLKDKDDFLAAAAGKSRLAIQEDASSDEVDRVNLDDYTKDEDVILSVFDTPILEKSLYFLTLDQLGQLVDKLDLKRPKSESVHVWAKLLVKKIPAAMWKELIENIFNTFKTEQ